MFAVNIPSVVASWNIMFKAPLRWAGAISDKYSGTAFYSSQRERLNQLTLKLKLPKVVLFLFLLLKVNKMVIILNNIFEEISTLNFTFCKRRKIVPKHLEMELRNMNQLSWELELKDDKYQNTHFCFYFLYLEQDIIPDFQTQFQRQARSCPRWALPGWLQRHLELLRRRSWPHRRLCLPAAHSFSWPERQSMMLLDRQGTKRKWMLQALGCCICSSCFHVLTSFFCTLL